MKFLKKSPKEISTKLTKRYTKRLLKINSYTRSFEAAILRRGVVGIRILENCKLSHKQLENIRRLFLPLTRKASKIWFNGNFSVPTTKKSTGTRMGKGKGKLDSWISLYKKGQIVVEFEELKNILAVDKLFKSFKHKLPFKFCIVKKNNLNAKIRDF